MLTNPDDSEHLGEQNPPFVANDGGNPASAFYGSGMYVISDGNAKLGPYDDAEASHQFLQSQFHRSVDFCGTCHDVSNPVVGDLAHNHGAQPTADPVVASGIPGAPVAGKAAFNNFPYQYGIVERTFSEYKSGALVQTRVADYTTLPPELQAGSIERARNAALLAGNNGDYADGTPRYFSCQTCHMRPAIGQGCNKNPPVRSDLPQHDQTGGNYWMPDVLQYLDAQGELVLGGGLTTDEIAALDAGALRARQNLEDAASLSVDEDEHVLTVVNLTGHKLITGYPEGRRTRRPGARRRSLWPTPRPTGPARPGGRPRRRPARPGALDPRSRRPEYADLRGALRHDPGMGEPAPRAQLFGEPGFDL
jgi:hypothetical protein